MMSNSSTSGSKNLLKENTPSSIHQVNHNNSYYKNSSSSSTSSTSSSLQVPKKGKDGEEDLQPIIDEIWKTQVDLVTNEGGGGKNTNTNSSNNNKANINKHELPLARIKRIIKSDQDVQMISVEAPALFAKACELFIIELTLRAWHCNDETKKKKSCIDLTFRMR